MSFEKLNMKKAYSLILLPIIIYAAYSSINIIISCMIGLGIGILMGPSLSYLRQKFNIPRALSALLLLLMIFAALSAVLFGLGLVLTDQINLLIDNAPKLTENFNARISSFFEDYPRIEKEFNQLNIGGALKNTSGKVFSGVRSTLEVLTLGTFSLVLSLYFAVSSKYYFNSLLKAFPATKRDYTRDVLKKCATKLRLWFKAQLFVMLILGLITSIGLWIVGVEYWALYGLLTAIFSLVPYIGVLIVVSCAVLITLSSNAALVPWVVLVFVVTQQIEGNVVIPLLMKDQLELPEVPLLIFILFCGTWLGIIGIFIAPPIFAVLKVLYVELYLPKVDKV